MQGDVLDICNCDPPFFQPLLIVAGVDSLVYLRSFGLRGAVETAPYDMAEWHSDRVGKRW